MNDKINRYQIFDYDLIGNDKEGFEIDGVCETTFFIDIDEDDNLIKILKKVKKVGFLKKSVKYLKFTIEVSGPDQTTFWINYNHCPLFELHLID